ncbi:MAG: NAD-dependent epimerase/dehydratase family protein, partial [Paracoccaceae bacterium]
MKIVIIGGAGVIGQKLAGALLARGHLRGRDIQRLTLADVAPPPALPGCLTQTVDITDPASVARALPKDTDVVYHLAAVVSAHAEADFDTGMAVNLTGTLTVLDRLRTIALATGTPPVVIYTSSAAV